MQETLVIVFTQRHPIIDASYLRSLGLLGDPCFETENCRVGVVGYPFGGQCATRDAPPSDADVLLVQDENISDDTRSILRHYIDDSERVVVTYHIGADEALKGHRSTIRSLCEDKEICSTEEHSTYGNTFDALTKVAEAISESDRPKYDKAVKQIVNVNCIDVVLEAKLDLLHRLLVPPAEDSGEWKQIEEDWTNLMGLVEADSEKENEEQYEQAWEKFRSNNPQQYSGDPFNEKYCGSEDSEGMLEKLRDHLLATAS